MLTMVTINVWVPITCKNAWKTMLRIGYNALDIIALESVECICFILLVKGTLDFDVPVEPYMAPLKTRLL